MRNWMCWLWCLCLVGCASAPALPPAADLFHDERFAAPSQRIDAAEVFALSDEMKRYVHEDIAHQLRVKGTQRGLVDALYQPGQLKLDYDATMTRNAREAFATRSGNCLSLLIMTAALAKELDLKVEYQSAFLEEVWSRSGNFYLRSGHVNITLGHRFMDVGTLRDTTALTIDFLPAGDLQGLRTRSIGEKTVIAMYMNNRAAETLLEGRLDDAYAWAREAVAQDPTFLSAYNTLGVIYLHHGDPLQADAVFARVLGAEPRNTRAMFNRAQALALLGHADEANVLYRRLAELEPYPPFHFFNLGMAAMERADYRAARDLFAKEVQRAEYNDEFHYWLGVANYRLGDVAQARKHLALAMDNSTTRGNHERYAAKLAWLKSVQHP